MPARRRRIAQDVEDAILELSARQPMLGRIRAAAEINRLGFAASPSTVRSIWRRYGLQTADRRVAAACRPVETGAVAGPPFVMPTGLFGRPDSVADEFVFAASALALVAIDVAGDWLPAQEPALDQRWTHASDDHSSWPGADVMLVAIEGTTAFQPDHSHLI